MTKGTELTLKPIEYGVTKIALKEQLQEFAGLQIHGINDKDGYEVVRRAIATARDLRLTIEAKRKELKQVSLDYGRMVDDIAKDLQAEIEPVEQALRKEKEKVDNELERIRAEKEAERQRKIGERINALLSLGFQLVGFEYRYYKMSISVDSISTMPDSEFDKYHTSVKAECRSIMDEQQRQLGIIEKLCDNGAAVFGDTIACMGETRSFAELFAMIPSEIDELAAKYKVMTEEYFRKQDELRKREEEIKRREAELREQEEAQRRSEEAEKRRLEIEEAQRIAAEQAIEKERKRMADLQAEKERKAAAAEAQRRRRELRKPDIEKLRGAVAAAVDELEKPFATINDQDLKVEWQKIVSAVSDALYAFTNKIESDDVKQSGIS
jgi:DNA repair exonuclease SbcCD ATPase subunit